ncbi:MAG: anaerobic ribonucleoside-triphosphate reductase activating protein [Erysipelotrichaceae bacterium]
MIVLNMELKIRLSGPLTIDSIVDGVGLRCVVWTQGCPHNCPNCHNPLTHDMQGGELVDVATVVKEIKDTHLQTGLTLSGGEPFMQPDALLPIVAAAIEMNMNIWAYTGFLYEDLITDPRRNKLLKELDILVDGKFIEELRDPYLRFKGSSNQRVIDVQSSLKNNKVILSEYN